MTAFVVFQVRPRRVGKGEFEGIFEPGTWEVLPGVVEAETSEDAVKQRQADVHAGLATAVPVSAIEGFWRVERHYVLEVEKMRSALAEAAKALDGYVPTGEPDNFGPYIPAMEAREVVSNLDTRELVTATREVKSVEVVLAAEGDLSGNHWPEGSTLSEGPTVRTEE